MKLLQRTALAITALMCILTTAAAQQSRTVEIHQYFTELAARDPTVNHKQLVELTDKAVIHKQMTVNEMSEFIKSTRWQTRMVYAYSKSVTISRGVKYMTTYDLVHSLADDLFQRKALMKFVSKRQKDGLLLRRDIIDWADEGRSFTEDFLLNLAAEYDKNTFTQEEDNRDEIL